MPCFRSAGCTGKPGKSTVRLTSFSASLERARTEAAQASGANPWQIIRYHVVGNVAGPVFVYASTLFGVSIVFAAGLSFLGLGVAPPTAEWGLMLASLKDAIYTNPWVAALPGAAIFLASVAFNLVSDGLRDALDVRV